MRSCLQEHSQHPSLAPCLIFYYCRDAAERDLAAAERAVKQLELAAPKAAQLAAAKREEAADLEARLEQLQVC